MTTRKKTPDSTETAVLTKSRRRCPLCFHLEDDRREKKGQIAHLDQDPSNYAEDNLAYMCMEHHSTYDSKTSQHKNYTLHEVKQWRGELYKLMEQGIVAAQSTATPNAETDSAKLRRDRDVAKLNRLLGEIHWPTVEQHIDELPGVVILEIGHFWEGFHDVYLQVEDRFYDLALAAEIKELHRAWEETLSYDAFYSHAPASSLSRFDRPPLNDEQQAAWDKVASATWDLKKVKGRLIKRVHDDYVDVDLDGLSDTAWKNFVEFIQAPLN